MGSSSIDAGTRVAVNFDNIPGDLRVLDRWLLWEYRARTPGAKATKVPVQVNGLAASTNRPETWNTFETVQEAYENNDNFAGVGITIPEGFVGVDFDDCITAGKRDESLNLMAEMLPTYMEISPSGTGVKGLMTGVTSIDMKSIDHKRGVEIYDGATTNRFFTLTGNVIDDDHREITGCRRGLHNLQTMITAPIGDRSILTDSDLTNELSVRDVATAAELLRHLPEDMKEEHDMWLMTGMALHHIDPSDTMMAAWDAWSRTSDKFEEDACKWRWDSFGKNLNISFVGLPWLKKIAKQNGYNPDRWSSLAMPYDRFMSQDIRHTYIVDDILVEGECCLIGGASKTLKTSIGLDLALSIATGSPFLGKFEVLNKRNVFVISGESGALTLMNTMGAIAESKGLCPEDIGSRVQVCCNLPQLTSPDDQTSLVRELADTECNVVLIDPLYMCMKVGGDASNVYEMGQVLQPILQRFCSAGITPVLLHHFRKAGSGNYGEAPELVDFSQSGVAEAARQWMLLKRRAAYKSDGNHELWFSYGGSAGHQGAGILDIHNGTNRTGTKWDPKFYTHAEWDCEEQKRTLSEAQTFEAELLDYLRSHEGDKFTKTGLATQFAMDPNVVKASLNNLVHHDDIDTKRTGNIVHYIYNL